MKILVTGDLVINRPYDVNNNIGNSLFELFKQSNINILNLEAPVTSNMSKILKTGPNIKADRESTLDILKKLKVDIVTLANNHVLDYGEQGVIDTIKFCRENEFQTIGAGENLEEASKTLYIDSAEGKIAIINFAENEWSSATVVTAGANPMDIIDNAKQIKDAKNQSDFVFVIVHGGHEYYNLPSPRMQKQYRFYAEQGADIVIGHHTHCISGNETYLGVPIFYSLGNFLFTSSSSLRDWYVGMVLEINVNKGKLYTKLHPVQQQNETFKLDLLYGTEKSAILDRVKVYSNIIEDKVRLKHNWDDFVESKYNSYLNNFSPLSFISNRYLRAAFRKLKMRMINKKGMALTLNLIRCEAHSDVSKEVINKYLSK